MSAALVCDGPDCSTWSKAGPLTADWVTIDLGVIDSTPKHFCCGWCAVRWLSTWAEPTETVDL